MKNGYYDNNVLAGNLKRLMERKSKRAVDVANGIGVSQATVSEWLKGRKIPRMDKVQKLANFFEVETSALIGSSQLPIQIVSENEQTLNEISDIFTGLTKANQMRLYAYALELQEQERLQIVQQRIQETQKILDASAGTEAPNSVNQSLPQDS